MNYYPRFPAHYLSKTLHLTMLQDGAYTRLMDWYYTNERPVPHAQRYAIARCQSPAERKAVDEVLADFFERSEEAWMHHRIEDEITKAAPKIAAAKANGSKGGRPRNQNPKETQGKPTGFLDENPLGFSEKPSAKAPQSPIPNNSVGKSSTHTGDLEGCAPSGEGVCDGTNPGPVVLASVELRKLGLRITPQHPDLIAGIGEGVTVAALTAMAEAYPGKPAGYVINAARRQHAEGATPISTGPPHAARPAAPSKTRTAIERLQALKIDENLPPRLAQERDPRRLEQADDAQP